MSERFSTETLKTIVGSPWGLTPYREIDAREIPEFRALSPDDRHVGEHADQVGSAMPRRVKLTKDIMEQYGLTPQCQGCINQRLGRYHRPRTESCRAQIKDLLRQDALLKHKIQAAAARQDAWMIREQTQESSEETAEIAVPTEGGDMMVVTPQMRAVHVPGEGGPTVVHIPDFDLDGRHATMIDDDTPLFNGSDDDVMVTSYKRGRGSGDDGLEAEDEFRGNVYTQVEEPAPSSSSGQTSWLAQSDTYGVPTEALELI